MELDNIYCIDAVEGLKSLGEDSIRLTITSPPYDDLRTYGGFKFEYIPVIKELFRVTCKGGVVVWVVADQSVDGSETGTSFRQALEFLNAGFKLHDTMIYQKRNFSHPEKTRYHSVFEYMFVFSKGKPRVFNPIKDRKNLTAGAIGNLGVNTFTKRDGSKSVRTKKLTWKFGMRHNVWLGNTRGQEEMCVKLKHPAMMPKWVARDHIISWTNEGDIILDPMMGSGTVPGEAKKLNRRYIGFDINEGYCKDAREYLEQIK